MTSGPVGRKSGQQSAKDMWVFPRVTVVGARGGPPPTGQEDARLPIGQRAAVSPRPRDRRALGGSLPATTNANNPSQKRKTLPDRLSP